MANRAAAAAAAAEKGWVVRVTVMEEPGKPAYHYFLTGCGTEAEAIAAVRSYPGIQAEDNVKTMRPLSHTELSEFKESLAEGEVRLHEGDGVR
jgi:hypothetical protein